jgi:hypothetical protein
MKKISVFAMIILLLILSTGLSSLNLAHTLGIILPSLVIYNGETKNG